VVPHADWDHQLTRVVVPTHGSSLHTLADARDYIVALSPGLQHQEDWRRTEDLLRVAAESGKATDIQQATFQLELALAMHKQLAGRG